jgi:O-antigen ligase
VTARLEPGRTAAAASLAGLAALMGLVAGLEPTLAIGAAIGIGFLLLTLADLTVGLTIFTAASFLELTSVSSGVGLAKVIGVALALSWIATLAVSGRREKLVWSTHPGLVGLVVAFIAWNILSLVWAENRAAALEQLQPAILVAVLIPIVYTGVTSARDVKMVTAAFVLGATVAAAYGVSSAPSITGGAGEASQQLDRVAGTVGDPNVLASILIVGALLAVALAITQKRSPALRLLLIGCTLLCLMGVILTFSRGGLVALGAALLVAPFLARKRAATIAAALLVIVCIIAFITTLAPQDARERLTKADGGSGRTDIWKIGGRMVEANPVVGVGVGNFQSSMIHYQLAPGPAIDRTDLADNPSVAHNSYLEVLAEGGVIGLALFLGLVIAALAAATKATRTFLREGRSDLAVIAGAVVVSIVSLLASDFFISEQFDKQLWLLIALCPALHAIAMRGLPADVQGRARSSA